MSNESIKWKGLQWREFYVLEFYHIRVVQRVLEPKHLGILTQSFLLSKTDRVLRVLDPLINIYRLKMMICSERSTRLHETRTTMNVWLTMCQGLQKFSKYSGFDNQKSIRNTLKHLTE
jgi:hypothetical protein